MKRYFAITLALLLCLSLCACGGEQASQSSGASTVTSSQENAVSSQNSSATTDNDNTNNDNAAISLEGEWIYESESYTSKITFNGDGTGTVTNNGEAIDITWVFDDASRHLTAAVASGAIEDGVYLEVNDTLDLDGWIYTRVNGSGSAYTGVTPDFSGEWMYESENTSSTMVINTDGTGSVTVNEQTMGVSWIYDAPSCMFLFTLNDDSSETEDGFYLAVNDTIYLDGWIYTRNGSDGSVKGESACDAKLLGQWRYETEDHSSLLILNADHTGTINNDGTEIALEWFVDDESRMIVLTTADRTDTEAGFYLACNDTICADGWLYTRVTE